MSERSQISQVVPKHFQDQDVQKPSAASIKEPKSQPKRQRKYQKTPKVLKNGMNKIELIWSYCSKLIKI